MFSSFSFKFTDFTEMSQNEVDFFLANFGIMASCDQVHDGTNTTVNNMKCWIFGKTSIEKNLNKILSKVAEVGLSCNCANLT